MKAAGCPGILGRVSDTGLSDGARVDHRPQSSDRRAASAALSPWRSYFSPRFYGLENIPESGAVLLVGNHTVFGLLDLPLMADEVNRSTGRFVRGLAENAHYWVPGWRDLLQRAGAVRGTRDNCRALLAGGEAVLVFPGGGREVAKRKGEKYELIWKQRLGFARMAVEAGCPIVPFGAVGAEEAYDILLDADSPMLSPIRLAVERAGGRWDLAWPLVRGVGPTLLPKPERFYFAFGEPIPTVQFGARADDDDVARSVRAAVKASVEDRIDFLLDARAADPHRRLRRRVATSLARRLGGSDEV